jgi:uncharacterized membrane protein YkvA (DUF1232 family)
MEGLRRAYQHLQHVGQTLRRRLALYAALYQDPRTPRTARILLWLALAYVALPFDLIPDFLPVLGQLDDALIVPVLIALALRCVPAAVYTEHYRRLSADWEGSH